MNIVNVVIYWLGVGTAALAVIGLLLLVVHELIDRAFELKDHFDLYIEFCHCRSEKRRKEDNERL